MADDPRIQTFLEACATQFEQSGLDTDSSSLPMKVANAVVIAMLDVFPTQLAAPAQVTSGGS